MGRTIQYRQLAEAIESELQCAKFVVGDKLESVRELATKHAVSVPTVSRALKLLEARGIVERRWGLGCFLASKSRGRGVDKRLHRIGVLLAPDAPPMGPWSHALHDSLLAGIKTEGARPVFLSWEQDLTPASEVDGLLVGSYILKQGEPCPETSMGRWMRALVSSGFPMVTVDFDLPGAASVRIDNVGGMAQVARYLIHLGHRKIAYLGMSQNTTSDERLKGLRQAFAEARLPGGDVLVRPTRPSPHTVHEIFPTYFVAHHFTAICCYEDFGASGAVKAALEIGLTVPGDLSVVGFGNLAIGPFATKPLTTVDAYPAALAARATHLLLEMISTGKFHADKVRVPTQLIVRETTGPVVLSSAASTPAPPTLS